MYQLGGKYLTRFSTSRALRKRTTSNLTLLSLHRMTKHMDQPYQSRAQKELKRIFEHHKLPVPSHPGPFLTSFLAHDSFKQNLREWLKTFIRKHQHTWIPLFWPSSTVMEGCNRTLADCIHNWRKAMDKWTHEPPTQCHCGDLLKKCPDLPHTDGHIAGAFSSKHLPINLQFLAEACTKDGVFLPQKKFVRAISTSIKKWIPQHVKKDLLPIMQQDLEQFVQ